jgi:hypothetical protein
VSGSTDSVAIIPDRAGMFELGVQVSVSDSSGGLRTFPAPQTGVLVVPDNSTETFEHQNLSDHFPWRTSGESSWKISPANAHTGSRAAEGGGFAGNSSDFKYSTLELPVSLPRDTSISFVVKTLSATSFDGFEFYVDSLLVRSVHGYADWQIVRTRVPAGQHTLSWKVAQLTITPAMVWVDNIFLPAGSVVTSTPVDEQIPLVYSLAQNYPNPFNPTTVFRYQLPAAGRVRLAVYDLLGREVAALVDGTQKAGTYEAPFDGRGLASGVYICRLVAGDFVAARKMILAK